MTEGYLILAIIYYAIAYWYVYPLCIIFNLIVFNYQVGLKAWTKDETTGIKSWLWFITILILLAPIGSVMMTVAGISTGIRKLSSDVYKIEAEECLGTMVMVCGRCRGTIHKSSVNFGEIVYCTNCVAKNQVKKITYSNP